MPSFLETVDLARRALQQSGRVSVRALKREYELDDESLEELIEELVDVRRVAERQGTVLVWVDGVSRVGPEAPERATPAEPEGAPPEAASPAEPTGSQPVRGERRQLTVLFCDLVGSTELAQRIDPEELSEILREYRTVCGDATKRFGGYVAQYLGDGVLIYFGYPQAHEDAASRAIRAGLEIQRVLADRSEASPIDARIGIHTGLVVVDTESEGEDALALGPTTNVASRIEGVAEPGTVVVSDATLALCRGVFLSRSLGERPLKGIEEPLLLHEIETMAGVRSARGREVAARPMVGRDGELGLLLDRWEEAQEGHGQVTLVSGEPGMGKSRLVQAFRAGVGEDAHLWLDLQCSPFTSGSAFQPLVDLFQTGLTLGESESPGQATAQLVRGLEVMPGLNVSKVVPYLLALLSLPPSEAYPLQETSADEQRQRTFAGLIELMFKLTEVQPVVVVAEDLQWSDPSTLEYFDRIVELAATTRLMIVLTFRPEFEPPWTRSHVSEMKIGRLSKRVTRELIQNAADAELPAPVLAELEARCDGVPLFIEELTSGVISSGLMAERGGRLELSGSARDLAIPATLQDSLMARLDRLSMSKQVAQQAATLGREFPYELIEAVSDLDVPSLRSALGQLVEAEILHHRGNPPDATYTFKHALLRDTAYESQLLSTRRVLHAKIAATLEERFPQRVEREPEVVARHCAAAGAHEKAVDNYQRAAELAVARLSNQEAAEHFVQALGALASLPESAERDQREVTIRLARGKSLMAHKGYSAAETVENYVRVEGLCSALGEGPQQLPALLGLVQADRERGDIPKAQQHAKAILAIAEPLGVPQLIAVGEYMVASGLILTGSVLEADERMARALEVAGTVEFPPPATPYDIDLVSILQASHALAQSQCGKWEQARESLEKSRERFTTHGNDYSRIQSLSIMPLAGYLLHDPELARETAREALAIGTGRGFYTAEVMATICGGWAAVACGDTAEGVAEVERGLALAESSGAEGGLAVLLIAAAHAHRLAGDRDRAEEILARAEALYLRTREPATRIQLSFAAALIRLELGDGDPVEVEKLLLDTREFVVATGRLGWEVVLATHLARLAPQLGKSREAHERLTEAYSRLTEGFERAPAREARVEIDKLAGAIAADK